MYPLSLLRERVRERVRRRFSTPLFAALLLRGEEGALFGERARFYEFRQSHSLVRLNKDRGMSTIMRMIPHQKNGV